MIRVLVVDDSLVVREIITKILRSDPEIEIVGTARNGVEAIDMATRLRPSIITMDVNMPIKNGLEAIEEIMAYTPIPILVISSLVNKEVGLAFRAMELGALDVFEKPTMGVWEGQEKLERELKARVKLLSKIKVITHLSGKRREQPAVEEQRVEQPVKEYKVQSAQADTHGGMPLQASKGNGLFEIVAIGTSTGGPKALQQVLSQIPGDFPLPIVIVQHIVNGFTEGLVEWLETQCRLKIKLGKDRELLQSGVVYIAPSMFHMRVDEYKQIRLDDSPAIGGFKPAATVLLSSVAKAYGSKAIGVILTGMGGDGAEGLKEMRDKGAATIAQDKNTSIIFGMPKVAIDMGAVQKVLPVDIIPLEIMRMVGG
ncbi:chemotaxis-specific protein-glutamate methyltransferase CheB [Candidatus Desantisbacteria bacterium]|nr:chemotaxis-specific protein-glutamate methyltransferase CheB [Candidatus Desantisbacteria bacterium]